MKMSGALWLLAAVCACRSVETGSHPSPSFSAAAVSDPGTAVAFPRQRQPAAAARTIGLDEVLALVTSQGIDVALASQRLTTARAEEDIARAAWYPQLSLGTAFYRSGGQVQGTAGNLFDVDKQAGSLDLGLSLEFDLGEALYGTQAAEHRTRAGEFDNLAARSDAVTMAAGSYFDLVETTARIAIADEALLHASRLVELQQARLDQGSGLEFDLVVATAHHARARRAQIGARSEARIASSLLIELLQLDPAVPVTPDQEPGRVPERVDLSLDHEDVPEFARPELGRAREELQARRVEERQAEWDWLLPDVFVGAGLGALGDNYGDLQSRKRYAAGLRWDLGAQLFGEQDRRRSRSREAELSAARTRAAIAREIDAALARSDAAVLEVEAVAHEARAAQQALLLATARYEQGAGLLIEVLQAQLAAVRSRSSQVAAVVGANRAEYAMSRALGRAGAEARQR